MANVDGAETTDASEEGQAVEDEMLETAEVEPVLVYPSWAKGDKVQEPYFDGNIEAVLKLNPDIDIEDEQDFDDAVDEISKARKKALQSA